MGGTAPGMNFEGGVPVGAAATIVSIIAPPAAGCGRLRLICYNIGPTETVGVCEEVATGIVGMVAQGYDRTEWLRKIALSARPYVMLTMTLHSLQVIPVYGLQQYHVIGGQTSVLEG